MQQLGTIQPAQNQIGQPQFPLFDLLIRIHKHLELLKKVDIRTYPDELKAEIVHHINELDKFQKRLTSLPPETANLFNKAVSQHLSEPVNPSVPQQQGPG